MFNSAHVENEFYQILNKLLDLIGRREYYLKSRVNFRKRPGFCNTHGRERLVVLCSS